jgi:putative transposase
MRQPSKTDLTDDQWNIVKPLIPPAQHGGRPREVNLREVLNTLLYQARTGCQWELLPHDRLSKSTVSDDFALWRDDGTWQRIVDALRGKVRTAAGREPTPRVGDIDSPTVQATEVGGIRGSDGGKKTGGRKRHLVVDALGLLLVGLVTAAAADDGATAPELLGQLDRQRFPRLEVIWGDGKYRNDDLDAWLAQSRAPFRVAVVKRPAGSEGFVKLPKRWVSERTFAWRGRDRRHSKDYEWYPESSDAWVQISAIGQMVRRLAPDEKRERAPFMYRRKAAA